MKCVILAAGRGTRMGHLTDDCPKPMLAIKGRPKLAYTLDALPTTITEVIFVVGYLQEHIREYFGDEHMGRKITYVEQEELLGTEHALRMAAPHLEDEKFLVLNGDDLYLKEDLEKLLTYDYAALAYHTEQAAEFGYMQTYEDGSLRDVLEKPHGFSEGPVNTGTFVLTSDYFDFPSVPKAPGSDEFGLPQTLVAAYPEIKTHVVVTKNWFPIGDPDSLTTAQEIIHDFI